MSMAAARALQGTWDELRLLDMPGWLANAARPELLCAALAEQVPEFASGRLTLRSCKVKRCRLQEDTGHWSGTYVFAITRSPEDPPQVVPVRGELVPPGRPGPAPFVGDGVAFGSEAWRVYLPELRLELRTLPADGNLPLLPQLTDPEAARGLLERSIQACTPRYHDLRIEACSLRVARYKPGNRCTVLYRLQYPAGRRGPETVVAKLYRGDEAQNVYSAMRALWDSPLGRSGIVAIAEPLAFVPELKLLVQDALREEHTLKQFLSWVLSTDTPSAWLKLGGLMRKTALGLAELHGCGVRFGGRVEWEDKLREVREWNARLDVSLPWHAWATGALLSRLEELAPRDPADPAGPAHCSFRPVQVLLHGEDIGFVDFDGFCQAEPAFDLALFMTEIRHIGLSHLTQGDDAADGPPDPAARRVRLARLDAICDAFLDEYTSLRPVSRRRIALWEALFLVALLQSAWTKLKPERRDEALVLLERHELVGEEWYRRARCQA